MNCGIPYARHVPERIMYVQLKSGFNTDAGPAWIDRVRFSKSWRTAYFQGRTLHRVTGTAYANADSNFYDVETGEGFWVSGPKRDRTDARYSSQQPTVEADVLDEYNAFLVGAPSPGRENG
jgi:hypothetical protein